MTKYSVIGKFRNKETIQKLVGAIKAKGYDCYDFTAKPADPTNPNGTGDEQMKALESHPDYPNDPVHKHHFETDLKGLLDAEVVVLLLPAGNSAHMEAGIAYGLHKKTILIGKPEKPETLYYIFDEHYDSEEDFLKTI
ncbi:MAG TPA: hypothetical protein VIJ29_02640 [Candidatus Paceibacterota bacterium]